MIVLIPLLLAAAAPLAPPRDPLVRAGPRAVALGAVTVEILPVASNRPGNREGTPHRQTRRRGNEVMIEFF